MRCIKPFLIGFSSAIISVMGQILRNSPSDLCTGACRTCGGVCLHPILIMPAAGVLVLIIRKIRKCGYLFIPSLSGLSERLKMQVGGKKKAEQLHKP